MFTWGFDQTFTDNYPVLDFNKLATLTQRIMNSQVFKYQFNVNLQGLLDATYDPSSPIILDRLHKMQDFLLTSVPVCLFAYSTVIYRCRWTLCQQCK